MDLSIAIPVTFARLRYLLITLNCLRYQTYDKNRFEVVVGVDGGGHIERIRHEVSELNLPYLTRVIETPRPFGHVAHRNHARNGAIKATKSNWIWILDSDQLVEKNAISAIITEKNNAIKRGVVPVLVQTIFNMNYSPQEWLRQYDLWNKDNYNAFFNGIKPKASAFSGYASLYKKIPGFTKLEQLQENMPVFPRKIFDALDGFDESFLGWGGNKHEFSRRLDGLYKAGLIELRLLHNVRLYHQSHPNNRHTSKEKDITRANQTLFHKKIANIRKGRGDWKQQVDAVRKVISNIKKDRPIPIIRISVIANKACDELRGQIRSQGETMQLISVYKKPPKQETANETMIVAPWATDIEALNLGASVARGECLIFLDRIRKPQYQNIMHIYQNWLKIPQHLCVYNPNGCLAIGLETYQKSNGLPEAITDTPRAFEFLKSVINDGSTNSNIIKPTQIWEPKGLPNNIINKRKLKVSLGIITYKRLRVLKQELESLFDSLRPGSFDYDIVVSDDGSSDGTIEYLKTLPVTVLENKRGGVAAQANRILSYFNGKVDYGFLANDDLLFKEGWEALYIHALRKTQYSHFVFMDLALEKRIVGNRLYPPKDIIPFEGGYMVNWAGRRIEGAFLTFDQKVIDIVGGMDSQRFKLFGHEHVDWTVRNKRAKLAPGEARWTQGCYDILGSNNFINLNLKDYKRSVKDSEIKKIMGGQSTEYHFNQIENDPKRIFLPL